VNEHRPAAEFKPARLTRTETVTLLGLRPLFAHALPACLSPCPPLKHYYSRFARSLSLNVSFPLYYVTPGPIEYKGDMETVHALPPQKFYSIQDAYLASFVFFFCIFFW
jgi:hypothetical protein